LTYLDDDFIDRVRDGNDIIDVISAYLRLEQAGRNHKGLCPFHEENTPSFIVTPDNQLYHCFGCGAGGNIFNFIMEIENIEFVEAVEILAERIGLSLPQKSKFEKKKVTEKSEIYEIHEWVAKFFNYLLTETEQGAKAYAYLQERGFERRIIDKFKLGYAPDSWQSLFNFLKKKGYSAERIHQSGLIIPRKKGNGYYDRFRNRLIFTIFNARGKAIGFGGRVLDDSQPKYLNSPDTPIFDKGNNLYGLHLAKKEIRRSDSAIIVEGYTDMITAYQSGIKNIVASLGTSLTREQAKLLKRYAERVFIAYDGDAAGENATMRGLDILKNMGVEVYVIQIPPETDPDEVIKERGKKYFNSLLEEAISLIEFKIECSLKRKEISQVEDKVKVVDEIIPILVDIENEIEQAEYIKKVAKKIDTDIKAIKSRLKNYLYQKNEVKDRNYKDRNNKAKVDADVDDVPDIYLKSAKKLLALMLNDRQVLNLAKDELEVADFIIDEYKKIAEIIFDSNTLKLEKIYDQINDQRVKEFITELAVIDEEGDPTEYKEEVVRGYLKKMKEYQLKMKKERLEMKIQKHETEGNFDKVNQLLRKYQGLINNNSIVGREGD
jgi:DNA primase